MRFRNEKLFVKVGVTVNLSPGQPKINYDSKLAKFQPNWFTDCQLGV